MMTSCAWRGRFSMSHERLNRSTHSAPTSYLALQWSPPHGMMLLLSSTNVQCHHNRHTWKHYGALAKCAFQNCHRSLTKFFIDSSCLETSVCRNEPNYSSIFWTFDMMRVANTSKPTLGCPLVKSIKLICITSLSNVKSSFIPSLWKQLRHTKDQRWSEISSHIWNSQKLW